MGCVEESDSRSRIEKWWDEKIAVGWFLILAAISSALWAHYHPIPGVSIGLLALMAGIVSLRPRMRFLEKVAWVLLLVAFAAFEVKAIIESDKAATEEKKKLAEKLQDIQGALDTTLSQIYVIKDGIAVMLSSNRAATMRQTALPSAPIKPTSKPGADKRPIVGRFIDAEKLGLYLTSKHQLSSASVINDGTGEAGNFANQLVIGLLDGKWVAGGNNIKIGDAAFFPDALTIEVSSVKASDDDRSVEAAKTLQSALKNQNILATLRYTQQAFPNNFMRIKVSSQ